MGVYFGDLIIGSGVKQEENENIAIKPNMTKITLLSSAWDNSTLTQTATVNGIIADETRQAIMITPVFSSIEEIGNCNVFANEQIENGIVFKCDTVPTSNVEFYVKWEDITWI